jgi:hypothetical protein
MLGGQKVAYRGQCMMAQYQSVRFGCAFQIGAKCALKSGIAGYRRGRGRFSHEEHLRHLLLPFARIEIGEWQPDEQDSSDDVSGGAEDQVVHCLSHCQGAATQTWYLPPIKKGWKGTQQTLHPQSRSEGSPKPKCLE